MISSIYAQAPSIAALAPSAMALAPSGQTMTQDQLVEYNDRLKAEASTYKTVAMVGFGLSAVLGVGLIVQRALQNQRMALARAEGAVGSPYRGGPMGGQQPYQPPYQPPYGQPSYQGYR